MKEMKTPEFAEKMKRGPVVMMTVLKPAPPSMGKPMALWFIYVLVTNFFAAYIASRALGPGAPYLEVFRFVEKLLGKIFGLIAKTPSSCM